MSARAAKAIVTSEIWTDANPMLNPSSIVTAYCEPEAKDIHDASMFRNFADPDMYPHTKETEFKCIRWLLDLWNGPRQVEPYGAATIGSSEACMLAGQTFTGEDNDLQEIHDWLDAYEKKTGVSIPMRIDAASGGLVNPFLYPDYKSRITNGTSGSRGFSRSMSQATSTGWCRPALGGRCLKTAASSLRIWYSV